MSRKEQLSISLRCVNNEIKESFLALVRLREANAATISEEILDILSGQEIPLDFVVGQGYDGDSVISRARNGVQAIISSKAPAALRIYLIWSSAWLRRSQKYIRYFTSLIKPHRSLTNLLSATSYWSAPSKRLYQTRKRKRSKVSARHVRRTS